MMLKTQVSVLTNSVLWRRLPLLLNIAVASLNALNAHFDAGLILSLFTKGIWSLDFALVMLMRLANHWLCQHE